ncbi:maleylpyruvate isomerase family mycothiol-dependent enzyme [Gordonia sp. CPCC 205333]|uniref:maleylpyruvate isomerase family mycothiol-dependent enzyme n=1 Tax=Gordonia sp. CPCC 205333 TaxID=3140790 RepID=UPI003AF396B9
MSTYLRCAYAFAELVAAVGADRWDDPALGTWSIRTLVGHTGRSFDTVIAYAAHPEPEDINTPTAQDYYLTLTADDGPLGPGSDTSAIDARAIAAGVALGGDPTSAIAAKISEVTTVLAAQPAQRRVEVIFGLTMPLPEYLRTRVFELVVHTLDLSSAIGTSHALPPDAIADMTRLAAAIAASSDQAERVLLALTGREPLPAGFSVV